MSSPIGPEYVFEKDPYKNEEYFRLFMETAPIGVILADQDQRLLYINRKFIDLFGYTMEDIPTLKAWWDLACPEQKERKRIKKIWNREVEKAVFEDNEIEPLEHPVLCKDGTVRYAELRLNAIGNLNVVLFTDITDRKIAGQKLKESEEKFKSMAENSPIAIMIHQDDYVVYTNPAGEYLSGYTREELYRMRFWDIIHPDFQSLVRTRGRNRQAGGSPPPRYDFKIITKSGAEKWVTISGSATTFNGKAAANVTVIDITDRKMAVESLKFQLKFEKLVSDVSAALVSVSPEMLDDSIAHILRLCGEFIDADRSYLFRFSDDGQTLEDFNEWCSEGIPSQLHRFSNFSIFKRPWWTRRLKEDGMIIITSLDQMPPEAGREKEEFEIQGIKSLLEIAVVREGKLRRVLGFDSVKKEKNWSEEQIALLRVVAEIVSNAVSRQRAEKALKISEAKYKEILDTIEEGYYEVDLAGKFTFLNDSLCRIFGYKKEQLISVNYKMLYRDTALFYEHFNRVYKTGQAEKAANLPIITGDKRDIIIEASIALKKDDTDLPVGFRGVVKDVTERKLHEEKLEYLSFHDQLTGLYNRAYFDNELNRLNNSRNYPITIIACDLDGLKLINDTLGHERGDRLLITCAVMLKEVLRSSEIVARVGGDEFVVILPQTDQKSGVLIVERIRERIEAYNLKNSQLPLSISLGLATAEKSSTKSLLETYKEADDLMYRDKMHKGAGAKSEIIKSLMAALGERDFITEGHARRLEELCRKVGEVVGLSQKQLSDLALLSQVHDLGKVGIPDRILFKEGPLNEDEWDIMKTHPEKGHRIASASSDLYGISDLILKHHEHWDGNGYPLGLFGENIPIECRILSLVDAYDAMTNDRPYRRAMSHEEGKDELRKNAGSQFDPRLVEIFLSII